MHLLVPPEIVSNLIDALTRAGHHEIGGVLMGEHVGSDIFRVKELTVQRKGGTFAGFIRIVAEILAPLRAFFDANKHNYTRFNYLGEWHSHPSFTLTPSERDHSTMHDMAKDEKLGAHFVVLLLVKLDNCGQLEAGVTIYQPSKEPHVGSVIQERLME